MRDNPNSYVSRYQRSLWDLGPERARRLDGLVVKPRLLDPTEGSGVAFLVLVPVAFSEGELQSTVVPLESETLSEALSEVAARFPPARWLGKTEGDLHEAEPSAGGHGLADLRVIARLLRDTAAAEAEKASQEAETVYQAGQDPREAP